MTADGWTSLAQDHYLTVSVHFVKEGTMKEKILHIRAVYTSQTGKVIAEEIGNTLDEFNIKEKVDAITVDNAANMDVAVKKMSIRKIGCFAHTLNIASQKLYTIPFISKWAGRIRAMVVWLKRCSLAKPVLKEKQRLLGKCKSKQSKLSAAFLAKSTIELLLQINNHFDNHTHTVSL